MNVRLIPIIFIGLVPNTIYRVTVRAKNIRAPQFDDKTASDKYASHIDFRTLPKGIIFIVTIRAPCSNFMWRKYQRNKIFMFHHFLRFF